MVGVILMRLHFRDHLEEIIQLRLHSLPHMGEIIGLICDYLCSSGSSFQAHLEALGTQLEPLEKVI